MHLNSGYCWAFLSFAVSEKIKKSLMNRNYILISSMKDRYIEYDNLYLYNFWIVIVILKMYFPSYKESFV